MDELEPQMTAGGNIVEYHASEFFPERWFDLVLVLRTDNTILYDRLVARGYPQSKVQENVEAEIVQVVLDEAQASYSEDIVVTCKSDTVEEMDATVERFSVWLTSRQWS